MPIRLPTPTECSGSCGQRSAFRDPCSSCTSAPSAFADGIETAVASSRSVASTDRRRLAAFGLFARALEERINEIDRCRCSSCVNDPCSKPCRSYGPSGLKPCEQQSR
jgi:hypothetical protein